MIWQHQARCRLRMRPFSDAFLEAYLASAGDAVLESVGGYGGKAPTLAEGALYSNDPAFYKKQLAQYASATPARSNRLFLGSVGHLDPPTYR